MRHVAYDSEVMAGGANAAYTVLYVGPSLGGRTTTAELFSALQRDEDRGEWVARLARGVPFRIGERTIELGLVVPHFDNLAYSIEAATQSDVPWISTVGDETARSLPKVQGVVMLVDSRSVRLDASLERLELTLAELARAGLDPDSLPFVFQLNHRDSVFAVSIDEVKSALRSAMPARVGFVESVASCGHGTRETFETMVAMIEGRPAPTLTGTPRSSPSSLPTLFEPFATPLTLDGMFRERLETRTFSNAIRLHGKLGVARAWPKFDAGVLEAAEASYAFEVVERYVDRKQGLAWSPIPSQTQIIAARMRAVRGDVATFDSLISVERSSTPFVLVGPKLRVRAAHRFWFGSPRTYDVASRVGFAVERGIVLFNVGTSNEAHVRVGQDRQGRAVDITVFGAHATELLKRS